MAERIQRKRTKGWTMPENTVYVGRPSRWGNPFAIGGWYAIGIGAFLYLEARDGYQDSRFTKVEKPEQSVLFYREYMKRSSIRSALASELRGKNLACWCPLDQPCHADVLLEIANA